MLKMSDYKINPYTGLPPRRDVKVAVVKATDNPGKYVIEDNRGRKLSKVLTKSQLDIAIQHALNAAASNRTRKIDDLGQALVNFRYSEVHPGSQSASNAG